MQKTIRQKFKRTLCVLLALLTTVLGLLPAFTAYAAVEKCSLNVRTSSKYQYMNNWAYPNARNGIHLATVADGTHKGEVAYCIEFGKDMGETGQSESVMEIEDVPVWQNFNATQKKGITYATIYGYPNFTYGVSAEAAQVATQFIVWEYSQGYRTSADGNDPTAGLNGTSSKIENAIEAAGFDVRQQYYKSGVVPYDDVMTAYKGILNGIKGHKVVPSFRNSTVELKWNDSKERYEATVTDSNGSLADFAMQSANTNLKFSKSGNMLTVYSSSPVNTSATVTMTKTCTTVGADVGFVPSDQDYNQSLVGRLTDPVTASFTVKTATGSAKIVKTAEDGKVSDIRFTIAGNGLTYTGVTDSAGVFLQTDIPAGTYTVTEETADKYVPQKSQTVTVQAGQTATVNFDNRLKKFRVQLVKKDKEKDIAQGDASLAGAKYGLFKGDELVAEYTTDENASFVTDYFACGTDWTIRELEASPGYLVDNTAYKVGADPKLYTVELNTTQCNVTEQVIKGNLSIIKHTDDGTTQIETPEVGAVFQVYLKSAGSYEKADPDERDLLTTDAKGMAKSKDLPYGVYVVHQTKGQDGTDLMPDFEVNISENGATKSYLINNAPFDAYLKIVKKDAETGKTIPFAGAGFQIYDPAGELVKMSYTYPAPTTIDTFYTNSEGYLLTPEKLPFGKGYKLVEVEAPYGYVLDASPIEFDITRESSTVQDALTVVQVDKQDTPQKGVIDIFKSGEIFSSVADSDDVYTPVYKTGGLPGTVLQIYAAEDIVTGDGTVRALQGELVDEITTDQTGHARSKALYLGKYTVVEKIATENYYNGNTPYDVTLTYAGQEVAVTDAELSITNARQKVTVSLTKELEQDKTFGIGMNGEIQNVQFGIFAGENVTAADGCVIPKDALLATANCDKNGKITFVCDLPVGFEWYVREIAADSHYVLSAEKYAFHTEYQGQDVQNVAIVVNDGEPIKNELIYGSVKGWKTDLETGQAIQGAVFGLFKGDETEFTKENALLTATTDLDGVFLFENVPYGGWIVKELQPAPNYLPSDTTYHVTIANNAQVIGIHVTNMLTPQLQTTATIHGKKEADAGGQVTVEDVVAYKHLIPGKTYVLKGVLMDKSTNQPFTVNGKEITAEVTFTPEKSDGETVVSFTFDTSALIQTTELVAFETLYYDGAEIAAHADINDVGQTVTLKVAVETPNTGDNSHRRTLATVMGVSALGIAVLSYVLLKKRKKNREEKA